jgi:hypothetical protein
MAGKRKSSQLSQQPQAKKGKKAQKAQAAAPKKLNPKDVYEASDEDADEEKYAYKFDVRPPPPARPPPGRGLLWRWRGLPPLAPAAPVQ